MARLPDREDLGARPVSGVMQPVVSPNGAAPARALQLVGTSLSKIGDEIYQKDAETEIARVRTALNQWEAAAIHDPKTGAKTLKGANAFKLEQELPKSFDDFQTKLLSGVNNKRARQAAELITADRKSQVMSWTGDYLTQQREVYDSAQAEAALQSSIQRVSLDPTTAPLELKVQEKMIKSRLGRQGLNDEAVEVALLGAKTATHAAVLENLFLNQNYTGARTYFAEHNNDLNADAREKYGKAVLEAGLRQDSQHKADEIMRASGTPEAALSKARAIDNPELRDATEARVRQMWSDKVSAINQGSIMAKNQVLSSVVDNNLTSKDQIDPSVWSRLDGGDKKEIDDYLKRRKSGGDAQTTWSLYNKLYSNRDLLLATDLTSLKPQLADAEFKELVRRKNEAEKGNDAGLYTNIQIADSMLAAAGVDPNPKGKDERANEKVAKFRRDLSDRVPKDAPPEQVTKEAAKLLTEVTINGWWSDKKIPAYLAKPGEDIEVPAENRQRIEVFLKKKYPSRKITDEMVRELYLLEITE